MRTSIVPLIAFSLLFAACQQAKSEVVLPVAPSAPTVVTIRGGISDQSLSPVQARIEVLSGTETVLDTHSDNLGRFELTGPFGGTIVTMRLSAVSYVTQIISVSVNTFGDCTCTFNMVYF
jgi:hypothetical protein